MSKKLRKKATAAVHARTSKVKPSTAKNKDKSQKPKVFHAADKRNASEYCEPPPFIAAVSKLVPIGDLAPHPLNAQIYGEEVDASFVNAVKRNGIYTPLLITRGKKIISGNRRFAAAKQAGIREVPVVEFDSNNQLDIREAIVAANRQREKTNEQMGREFKVLMQVETERARSRMKGVEKFPQDMQGKARDLAAVKLGVSGKTGEHAAAVVDKIDQLNAEGKSADAEDIKRKLNKSVNGAYNRVAVLNLRKRREAAPEQKIDPEVPPVEGKADIITRIQDYVVEGVEEWAIETLRNYEACLKACRSKFEVDNSEQLEAA